MTIENYILNLENLQHAQLIEAAHNLMESLIPQVESSIKWKVPYYKYGGNHLCYISPHKKGWIDISFVHGKLFSNEQGILQGRNRKYVMSLEINSLEELYQDAVAEVILEAVTINEELKRSGHSKGWFSKIRQKKN